VGFIIEILDIQRKGEKGCFMISVHDCFKSVSRI